MLRDQLHVPGAAGDAVHGSAVVDDLALEFVGADLGVDEFDQPEAGGIVAAGVAGVGVVGGEVVGLARLDAGAPLRDVVADDGRAGALEQERVGNGGGGAGFFRRRRSDLAHAPDVLDFAIEEGEPLGDHLGVGRRAIGRWGSLFLGGAAALAEADDSEQHRQHDGKRGQVMWPSPPWAYGPLCPVYPASPACRR